MRMSSNRDKQSWIPVLNGYFHDFHDFAQTVRAWDLSFSQLKPGSSPVSLQQFGLAGLLVSRFNMAQPYDQSGSTPNGMLTLGFLEKGSGIVRTPEGTVGEDDLWCFPAGREFRCISYENFRAIGLSISETLLDEVTDTCGFGDNRSRLKSNRIVRCGRRTDLDSIRRRLGSISRTIGHRRKDPPPIRADEHELVREFLDVLTDPQDSKPLNMTKRKRLVLERTLDYLDANPGSPITVYELARETGAGVRTLEYVFREYFGVTPKTYLSARRLAGARRELLMSASKPVFVGDIANRWGFWHLGRFSADYRKFFGELPSETLDKYDSVG